MAQNYVLLERIELNATAASVTFSNIPQTGYTDLKIVLSARSTANGGQNVNLTFNSTASGYSDKILSGNGSSAASFSSGNTTRGGSCVVPGADFTASTFGNGEIYIPNYTGSNYKSFSSDSVTENNTTTSYAQMEATLWSNSAAINTILIDLSGGSFASGSTFSLYGIAAVGATPAIAPKADGGNVIATDGTYWYHAFLSNGTFTPQVGLTADVLVIAGGGAGGTSGDRGSGGGGAGGLLGFTSQALTATNYTCAVGAGGANGGGGGSYLRGSNGANSQFASLTAAVGGGAAGTESTVLNDGLSGGSGGGGGGTGGIAGAGGSATSGQGYAGGAGYAGTSNAAGGGGGGAGAAGANASSGTATVGGVGSSTYSSWGLATSTGQNVGGTVYYAGGGGGASGINTASKDGGYGGGGGSTTTSGAVGVSGTANTGGGGGAQSYNGSPGNGGSGIIIVRYLVA